MNKDSQISAARPLKPHGTTSQASHIITMQSISFNVGPFDASSLKQSKVRVLAALRNVGIDHIIRPKWVHVDRNTTSSKRIRQLPDQRNGFRTVDVERRPRGTAAFDLAAALVTVIQ